MNRTLLAAIMACVTATACADVYGPADVSIELRLTETKEGSSSSTTEGIFWIRDAVHNLLDLFVFRLVDSEDMSREPVPTIIRNGQKIQPMPGILVEVTMHYELIEDCTTNPWTMNLTDYIELVQYGVKSTSKGCSPPLTSTEQVGDSRPTCILFDGPDDNGKSMLVRTGPHGTIQFDLIPRLSDPIQSGYWEIQVRSGGGAAGLSLPDDVEDICDVSSSSSSSSNSSGGTAARRPARHYFGRPIAR